MTRDQWIQLCGCVCLDGDTVTVDANVWDESADRIKPSHATLNASRSTLAKSSSVATA